MIWTKDITTKILKRINTNPDIQTEDIVTILVEEIFIALADETKDRSDDKQIVIALG